MSDKSEISLHGSGVDMPGLQGPALPSAGTGVDVVLACSDLGAAIAAMMRAFREAGLDTPGLDARRLLAAALGLDEAVVLREPERRLTPSNAARIADVTARRLAREPVSRIVGVRGFHGLEFELAPATLDPRPDTETLVDGILALVAGGRTPGGGAPRILDLGTGSGAILVALLAKLPSATGVGVDIADEALAMAQRNAVRLGVGPRAEFRRSNWFESVAGPYDIVVSNPPYIARSSIAALEPEVSRHDPWAALDGGEDGLDAYRAIISGAEAVTVPGGWLALEIGMGQSSAIKELLSAAGWGVAPGGLEAWHDLAGMMRCLAAARVAGEARSGPALKHRSGTSSPC